MSFIKKAILLSVVLATVFAYNNVNAQESVTVLTPDLIIRNLITDKEVYKEGDTIKITFDVENQDQGIYTDVYFEISLMSDYTKGRSNPTNSHDLERRGPINIGSDGLSSYELTYELPVGIYGEDHGIRLGLSTKTGLRFYRTDKLIDIEKGDFFEGSRIDILGASIRKGDEFYNPNAGPYFDDDEDVILYVNTTSTNFDDFVPILKLSEYSDINNPIYEKEVSYTEVREGRLMFNIEKPEPDGVYVGELKFLNSDGVKRAKPVAFRFIKGNEIVTIHSVESDKQSGYKGDSIEINTKITGQPVDIDTDETPAEAGEGKIQIMLLDHKDNQVGYVEKNINLNENTEIQANIVLEKDARFLAANIKVLDASDGIMEEYNVNLSDESQPFFTFYKTKILTAISILLLALILLISFYILRKKKNKENIMGAGALLILLIPILLFLNSSLVLGYNTGTYSGLDTKLGSFVVTKPGADAVVFMYMGEYRDVVNWSDWESSDGTLSPDQYFNLVGDLTILTCGNTFSEDPAEASLGNGSITAFNSGDGLNYKGYAAYDSASGLNYSSVNYGVCVEGLDDSEDPEEACPTWEFYNDWDLNYYLEITDLADNSDIPAPDTAGDYHMEMDINMSNTYSSGSGDAYVVEGYVPYRVESPDPAANIQADGQDVSSTIVEGGSSNLSWTTSNASQIYISASTGVSDDIGIVGVFGNQPVSPDVNTTYTIYASTTDNTKVATDTVAVIVTRVAACGTASSEDGWNFYPSASNITSGTCATGDTLVASPIQYSDPVGGDFHYYRWQCEDTPAITDPGCLAAKTPTLSLVASPEFIINGGQSTLTWSGNNVDNCSIDQGVGQVVADNLQSSGGNVDGNTPVSPSSTTTYTITCDKDKNSGPITASATVTVSEPVPTATLTADDSTVTRGTGTILRWSSTNATSCTGTGFSTGSGSPTSGFVSTGNLFSTTDYSITCTGPGGSASDTEQVVVETLTATIDLKAKGPGDSIPTDNPGGIKSTDSVTLSWTGQNISTCSMNQGINSVSPPSSSTVVTPGSTKIYTITCTGTVATNNQVVIDSVEINVYPPPTVDLEVNEEDGPVPINEGSPAQITWGSNNATGCIGTNFTILGGAESGSVTKYPSPPSIRYSISCVSSYGTGETATDYVDVNITPVGELNISASPSTIWNGESSTLSWSGNNISNCSIDNSIGSVSTSGSRSTGILSNNTTYTITCTQDVGGTISKSTTVSVEPNPVADLKVDGQDNDKSITLTDSVSLTWNNTNSSSCSNNFTGSPTLSGGPLTRTPSTNTTYTHTCSKTVNGSTRTDTDSITVSVSEAPSSINIAAQGPTDPAPTNTPNTITSGDPVTLTWTGTEIEPGTCSINQGVGSVGNPPSNTSVSPTISTTYTITCTKTTAAGGGIITDFIEIPVYPPPTVDLRVNGENGPVPINEGSPAQITWGSNNATGCIGTNFTILGGAESGSVTKYPSPPSIRYSISCVSSYGTGETATDYVDVNITPVGELNISASPSTIWNGESSTLSWSGNNISNCSIDNSIGSVSTSGSRSTGILSNNTTYTITCTQDVGGTISKSTTVSVEPNPVADLKVDGQDNDKSITLTDSVSLTWNNTNSSSCSNNFTGSPTLSGGPLTRTPSTNTTYTHTCSKTVNGSTRTDTDSITVSVSEAPSSINIAAQGPTDPAPTNTPNTITSGDPVTLTWTGTEIEPGTCSINQGVGSVGNPPSNTSVSPTISTTYTITCTKTTAAGGGIITDFIEIPVYPQPTVDLKVNGLNGPVTVDYGLLARITWLSTNSSSCTGTNFTILGGAESGSVDEYPLATVTYSVTCTSTFGNGETATDSVVVNVNAPTTPPACGTANGKNLFNDPAPPDLCAVGSSVDTADSDGQFNWECSQPGFPNVSCSATDIVGTCGSDEDGFFQSAPSGATLCPSGSNLSGSVTTTPSGGRDYWNWSCVDGLGTVGSPSCQAYKMPICETSNPDNPYTCTLGTAANNTAENDRFLWTCNYDYTDVFDVRETVDCILNCPFGKIVVGTTCQNVGNVTIVDFKPTEKVVNRGDDCGVNWQVSSNDSTANITCVLSGDDTGTFGPYTGFEIYTGSATTTNVQSRVSYTLTCTVTDPGVPVILGTTQDVAQTSCIINPDIDEF